MITITRAYNQLRPWMTPSITVDTHLYHHWYYATVRIVTKLISVRITGKVIATGISTRVHFHHLHSQAPVHVWYASAIYAGIIV